MFEPYSTYPEDGAADLELIEISCASLARAVELLDKMKASGIGAEFKGWNGGRACFAVALEGALLLS